MAISRQAFGQLNTVARVAWYPPILGGVCAKGRHAPVLPMNGCPSTRPFVYQGLNLEPGQLPNLNPTEPWIHVIFQDARIPSDGRVSFVRVGIQPTLADLFDSELSESRVAPRPLLDAGSYGCQVTLCICFCPKGGGRSVLDAGCSVGRPEATGREF